MPLHVDRTAVALAGPRGRELTPPAPAGRPAADHETGGATELAVVVDVRGVGTEHPEVLDLARAEALARTLRSANLAALVQAQGLDRERAAALLAG